MSRFKKDLPSIAQVGVRCTAEEKVRWAKAAKAAKVSLSEWVRLRLADNLDEKIGARR